MNLVKRFLMEKGIRGGIEAFEEVRALVKALLLPTLDFLAEPWPTSLSYFVKLAKKLPQRLWQAHDPETIAKV